MAICTVGIVISCAIVVPKHELAGVPCGCSKVFAPALLSPSTFDGKPPCDGNCQTGILPSGPCFLPCGAGISQVN